MVGKKIVHLREVELIRKTLRTTMGIYLDIDHKSIIYLLWAIFLDAQYLFSNKEQQGEALPESILRYTTKYLGVRRIPIDMISVPVAQLGVEEQIQMREDVDREGGGARL